MCMNTNDPKQVGALGGQATWSKVKSKKARSDAMKKVAANRWPKKK